MKLFPITAGIVFVLSGATCSRPHPFLSDGPFLISNDLELKRTAVKEHRYTDKSTCKDDATEYATNRGSGEPMPLSAKDGTPLDPLTYSFLERAPQGDMEEVRFTVDSDPSTSILAYYELANPNPGTASESMELLKKFIDKLAATGLVDTSSMQLRQDGQGINGKATWRVVLNAREALGTKPNVIPKGKFGIVINPPYP